MRNLLYTTNQDESFKAPTTSGLSGSSKFGLSINSLIAFNKSSIFILARYWSWREISTFFSANSSKLLTSHTQTPRISRHMPEESILGWNIGVTNLNVGGLKGYLIQNKIIVNCQFNMIQELSNLSGTVT